jgi:hypothetical protein
MKPLVADTCGDHQSVFRVDASPVEASNSSSNEQLHVPPPGFCGNTSPPQFEAGCVVALAAAGAAIVTTNSVVERATPSQRMLQRVGRSRNRPNMCPLIGAKLELL